MEEEQHGADRAEYGRQLLTTLADGLTQEYGRGFSRSNLEYMRKFFLAYRDRVTEIPQSASGEWVVPLISQKPSGKSITATGDHRQSKSTTASTPFKLSWSHYVFLMSIKNAEERQFYEIKRSSRITTKIRTTPKSSVFLMR